MPTGGRNLEWAGFLLMAACLGVVQFSIAIAQILFTFAVIIFLVLWSRERKRLRDLASLDKSAVKFCSRVERLRFLLRYAGKRCLDDEAKKLARACLDYRRRRWPEDWSGSNGTSI